MSPAGTNLMAHTKNGLPRVTICFPKVKTEARMA
jgi:hypothetical protein